MKGNKYEKDTICTGKNNERCCQIPVDCAAIILASETLKFCS
jgi:hypothetical protein